jgi:hypothetical protein
MTEAFASQRVEQATPAPPAPRAERADPAQPAVPAPAAPPGGLLQRDIERIVEDALQNVQTQVPPAERARIQEALARLRARREFDIRDSRPVIAQAPFDPATMIPPQAVDMAVAFFATCAIIIIGLPLARAFARRMDRRGATVAPPDLNPRLDRMEQAIEAIAIEVERISEGQRFVTRLMAEERGLPAGSPAGSWAERKREPEPVARSAADRGQA